MNRLPALLSTWIRPSRDAAEERDLEMQLTQVEEHPAGYPRFSALIGAENSFHICRRFSNIRARLLLLKQDKVSRLEAELEGIDREESAVLFLGSRRYDLNESRKAILNDLNLALEDYDRYVERSARILEFSNPNPRNTTNLQKWVHGNRCIARDEVKYLTYGGNELLCMATPADSTVARMEDWVEDNLVRFSKRFYRVRCDAMSSDKHVYIPSGSLLRRMAQAVAISLIITVLLGPAIICTFSQSQLVRTWVVITATVLLVIIISGLTKARTIDILIVGATYSTVLIVFISGKD
ncbi:uncharacterized protein APUU_61151S [Aspergillus puulaauensis]|uniref:DUF6594 domain-containing protein n=1 Tax=Aspergillus puulaauensis TaxID=1220207 RepID=A0A7R8ASM9_9EURO|nr:uncharacterized protein APUU_61151S [Aspergillus puulaauensis]BCS28103.1 hypothetical protein APUU_61151S [Aspergillus puulaauensis]